MSKITSRKFWVWIVWTIIIIFSIIYTKTVDAGMMAWYGAITSIYLGTNVAEKFILKGKE